MQPLLFRGEDSLLAEVIASVHRKRTTGTDAMRTAWVVASAPDERTAGVTASVSEERTAGVTASVSEERTAGVTASAQEERTAGVTASASASFFASPPPPASCQPSPPSDLRHINHTEILADTVRDSALFE